MAWREHFSSLFGREAARRIKGFSPPEMHLPIHPDICFAYIKALKECGYEWLMVQEHTAENMDATGIRRPHLPHRLIAKNSLGEIESITALVKTQGSDNKLIGQMQPYYEAKTVREKDLCGRKIKPYVLQIGDGENGGVMMNEFPPAYRIAFDEIKREGTVALNGSEYIEFIEKIGFRHEDFLPIQPISQNRIWKYIKSYHAGAADEAIDEIKRQDPHFNLDKGSWTNDKNWVKGYEDVLDPINRLSVAFHKKFNGEDKPVDNPKYKKALLYLLLSQTSCFRYWGTGIWTDYAKEITRRGMEVLK